MIRKLNDEYDGVTVEEQLLSLSLDYKLFNESLPRTANFPMIRSLIQNGYIIGQSIPAQNDGSIVKYLITDKGIARHDELCVARTLKQEEVKNE